MPSSTFLFSIPSKECPEGLFKVQKSTVSPHRAADGKRGAGLSRDGTVEETLSNTSDVIIDGTKVEIYVSSTYILAPELYGLVELYLHN